MNRPPIRAGRLLVLGFDGVEVPAWLENFAKTHGLGGIILFAKNCPDAQAVKSLCEKIKKTLANESDGWRPLVMVDQEGGRVERIKDFVPRLPSAREMAALGEEEVERLARTQSLALAELGIDVNLAPVCDVPRPGESGVIGDRGFGENERDAARFSSAFLRGMRAGGIISCAKHFPGHGSGAVDTHMGPGAVNLPVERLKTDLLPFQKAIESGVDIVMACHLSYPALDEKPATLSPRWLGEILREEMGFGGAAISDDMEMGGLRKLGDPMELSLNAVNAGCDFLIFGGMLGERVSPDLIASHLSEKLNPSRYEEALKRQWKLRHSLKNT